MQPCHTIESNTMEIYCAMPYLLSVPDQNPQIISNQAVKEWLGVFLRSRYKESIVTSGRSFAFLALLLLFDLLQQEWQY